MSAPDPGTPSTESQRVTGRQGLLVASLVAYMLLAVVVAEFYSGWIAALMGVPLVVVVFVEVCRMPAEQRAKFTARIEEQERTPLGKTMKLLEYTLLFLLALCGISWLLSAL